ncbi:MULTISPECIES: HAD-IIB family hydrolase [unclassified Breznakia]|uniref:HAD-IIB family hydrolase n=1 Tax=unclassified Breznakia TaxID=2623764 RepID=UPI00240583BF|nr:MULTISPECIES: HAD-IIB family hydrolase [unclassified Breznakia]MDF9838548.1 Cof subfamily protein (haloacid dehalogenase superfamily) [Breznakia sp. PFB2-8]MDF9860568.1 Cof subfamily protein (haloacid dehalogenase superfamily) [Breznakia sp. PH5-24]
MKVLATDYDGTLKVDGEISAENKIALQRWRNAGNAFGIVTGRSTTTIMDEIKKNKLDVDFLICNNGGVILDKDYNILKLSLIDFSEAEKILAYLETYDCSAYVLNDGIHRAKKVLKEHHDDLHNAPSTVSVETILKQQKIAQIVVGFENQAEANALAFALNDEFGDAIEAFANVNCVDMVPKGVSKAEGIAFVAKRDGLNKKAIYTIGDSYNDICMLEAFTGATLEHAQADIKGLVDYVVKDVATYLQIVDSL